MYKPDKAGTMNRSQTHIMTAVGDGANLQQIFKRSGYKSMQSVYLLVKQLVENEILKTTEQ